MDTQEKIILRNLIRNEDYARKVVPFLRDSYFQENVDKVIFRATRDHITEYNTCPPIDALRIIVEDTALSESEFKSASEKIDDIESGDVETDKNAWLVDHTEKFCKDKAIYNAILQSIEIIDGKSKDKTANALPSILSDALSVSFDTNIGHDYLYDAESRFESYHKVEDRMPFDLEGFNKVTNGGIPRKTLNVIMAGTNVGKSLFMCHHAAHCYSQGKNVLYITCEMAEERIAERIDANLMDITLDDLKILTKKVYEKKLMRVTENIKSRLIVKEYPTATANAQHFRNLLDELRLKKKFTPDIIFIDYINICASSRFKAGSNFNSYTIIKAIAEELRGLAIEYDVPIFTATQTNRTGFSSNDVGLEDTSESFGLPQTADFMFAMMTSEELEEHGQVLVKQLKNRYNDVTTNKRFVTGINRAKMKLYDVDDSDVTLHDNSQDNGQNGDFDYDSKFKKAQFTEFQID